MASLLEQRLVVISGKGGVGKTTVAAAVGLAASRRGLRTIVVELGEQHALCDLYGVAPPVRGAEIELENGLWNITIDPDTALLEWLQALGGRVSGRLLASSNTFHYFAAAAPGAKELVTMVKVSALTEPPPRRRRGTRAYDLVVLDAPATGHALGMLQSPWTFGAIARVGPIAAQTRRLQELLKDRARTSFVAVAHASEMAVTETLELREGLDRRLGRDLSAVIVNGVMPRRFTAAELRRVGALEQDHPVQGAPARLAAAGRAAGKGAAVGQPPSGAAGGPRQEAIVRSAAHAARAVHERARLQTNQIARLRRRGFGVITVPFQFASELELGSIRAIAEHLEDRL